MPTLQLVIVHQPEQTKAVIDFALKLADDSGREGDEWVAVFRAAAELAGQRVPLMPEMTTMELPPGLRLS